MQHENEIRNTKFTSDTIDSDSLLGRVLARVDAVEVRLTKLEGKKKAAKGKGVPVFEAYLSAYSLRYGVNPVRNAGVNRNCADMVSRLGIDDAVKVVEYYLSQNDAFYVKSVHPIKLCLKDCESLRTRMVTGLDASFGNARRAERTTSNAQASANYLKRKNNG